jgi:hypothetical protein
MNTKNDTMKRICSGTYTYRWFVISKTDGGSWAYGTQHETIPTKMQKRFGDSKSLKTAKERINDIMNDFEGV